MDRSGRVTFSALIGASMSLCALACTPDSDSSSSDGGLEASEAGGGSAGLGGNDAGQGGSDEWQGLARYEDQFPPACGALTKLVEYLYEYKSCATDGDCTVAQSTCLETKEHCSGAFYANVQHDATTLQTLFDAASTCPLESPCCTAIPAAPRCAHNRCVADGSLTSLTGCLAGLGGDDCDFCACAAAGPSQLCVSDPACIPIFKCAKAAGCYGKLGCDLASPGFPCKAEVDAAGGPKSPVAEAFRQANADAPRRGCDVACAAATPP